ncbi:MAG: hypothetical protein A2289_14455 [Deltaproteobacteria bacterium RIFOXYA12_FULL_58_15]|nr:MAG: hypothetical protein A2289_14455 [Deltaproteobacteria bacterium RIFOXYA12_FULL_58_15]
MMPINRAYPMIALSIVVFTTCGTDEMSSTEWVAVIDDNDGRAGNSKVSSESAQYVGWRQCESCHQEAFGDGNPDGLGQTVPDLTAEYACKNCHAASPNTAPPTSDAAWENHAVGNHGCTRLNVGDICPLSEPQTAVLETE